jgi:membrane protein insertase Oxa1/YidC/SpoIIIJ
MNQHKWMDGWIDDWINRRRKLFVLVVTVVVVVVCFVTQTNTMQHKPTQMDEPTQMNGWMDRRLDQSTT